MFNWLKKLFGNANDKKINSLKIKVEHINSLEAQMISLSDSELREQTNILRKKIIAGEDVTSLAFAVVREASKRVLNMRHFDEQIIGGLVLNDGIISEMGTGEGKTLVATLPSYLNALSGKGVHIVTVNDYLAKRDSEWMGQIFTFLGLTVGCIRSDIDEKLRKKAYQADITYATNNELGFDYLRDNMKFDLNSKVQRKFNYAIIDEVDSILIDEARTPLIISGVVDDNSKLYYAMNKIIKNITEEDYEKEEKHKTIYLNELGINKVEEILLKYKLIKQESCLYDFENIYLVHYIDQALKAYNFFHKDVDYIIKDSQIMIIDEFTGRIMEGRRYSDGLHQALEAKENLTIRNENQTLASITFQNYFRMYPKLSGMTGTALTEAIEFRSIYNLEVVSIPPNKTIARIDHNDEIYSTKADKYDAIVKLIKERNCKGQPLLIGTVSIEKSEEISKILKKHKIKHQVLNAKNHEKEADIIAQAGKLNAVTIATNMAGRGTDIIPGGNAEIILKNLKKELSEEEYKTQEEKIRKDLSEEKKKVLELGGLFVIGTERHESRRIDNQLRGRSGRQGDRGETKFFLSLEDDLMRIFAPEKLANVLRKLGLKGGEAIFHPMINRALAKAQYKVEVNNYEIRKNLLNFDNVMNEQRSLVYQKREEILEMQNIELTFKEISETAIDKIIYQFIPKDTLPEQWDIPGLNKELHGIFAFRSNIEDWLKDNISPEEILKKIQNEVEDNYKFKLKSFGEEIMLESGKYILITTLDQVWKDHLYGLDHLRQGISLRAYAQKDPLHEYRKEAFSMFENMLENLYLLFVQRISNLQINLDHSNIDSVSIQNKKLQNISTTREDPAFAKYNTGSSITATLKPIQAYVAPEDRDPSKPSSWGKINRNEQCPCKSGKKYKHCHGKI